MDSLALPLHTQLFGVLFDYSTEALFAIHRRTRKIVTVSRRLEELTGQSTAALIGGDASRLFSTSETTDTDVGAILDRAGLHEEVALSRIDGYPLFVSLTVAHVEHPTEGALAACIARDTTERRLLERELLVKHMALFSAHTDLERAVASLGERNRELAALGAQLSQAAKRAFIGELSAGIAHSLNNPLAALASAHKQIVATVETHGSPELAPLIERFTRRSRDAIARMEHIVQSVRRAHRSGSASTSAARLEVAKEIDVALSLFESRLFKIAVDCVVDETATAWAPASDLQHVLWNLFDNAILAMPEGGTLRIEVLTREQLLIVISDSGPGVVESMRPTLFQPFNSTRQNGTGLGLSTARRLARGWGGDVRLVPSQQHACFEISLPVEEPPCTVSES